MIIETPFFARGELGEKVHDLVCHYLYNEDNPNWTGLEFDLRRLFEGDNVAVEDAMRYIREGGF